MLKADQKYPGQRSTCGNKECPFCIRQTRLWYDDRKQHGAVGCAGLPAASASSSNGSGPPHGSAREAAREGGNGVVHMDVAVLDTEDATVSGNGAEFRRQNGSARTGQSAGPIRLPVSRDVSGRAVSECAEFWAQGPSRLRRQSAGFSQSVGPRHALMHGKVSVGNCRQRPQSRRIGKCVSRARSCRETVTRSLLICR